ncbi:MAG: GNAT family N-acetyltransferase [Rubrivivax sp.]
MLSFSLRPARPDDLELTYRITENAMRPYVEATWGSWVEEEQRAKHVLNYRAETHQVVLVDSEVAGLLAVEEHADHVWLVKVYLFDAWRNQGIGRRLVEHVIARGRALSKPVRLRVLRVNVRARNLYESLGFRVIEERPERFIMETGS